MKPKKKNKHFDKEQAAVSLALKIIGLERTGRKEDDQYIGKLRDKFYRMIG